jgi:hypothetical protein
MAPNRTKRLATMFSMILIIPLCSRSSEHEPTQGFIPNHRGGCKLKGLMDVFIHGQTFPEFTYTELRKFVKKAGAMTMSRLRPNLQLELLTDGRDPREQVQLRGTLHERWHFESF